MSGRRSEQGRQVLDATSAALAEKYGLNFNHNYSYTCGSVALVFAIPGSIWHLAALQKGGC